jgi:hypothetical protein
MPDFVQEIMPVDSFNLYRLATIATKIIVDRMIAAFAIDGMSKHKCYEVKQKSFPPKVNTKIFLKPTL